MSHRFDRERERLRLIGEAEYSRRMEDIRYRLRATRLAPKTAKKLRALLRKAEFAWSVRKLPRAAANEGAPTP